MPTRKAKPSSVDLEAEVAEYLLNRSTRERAEFREGKYKGQFLSLLAEVGELVGEGHRVLRLDEPLVFHSYSSGKAKEKTIGGIKRTRRISTPLNWERTIAFLQRKNMVKECTTTEVVINEDALLAAAFTGRITDEELQTLYDEKESFAFNLLEAGKEQDDDD